METQEIYNIIKDIFVFIWNFELFKAGSNSIQLNQIIIALVVIFAGTILSKKTANIISLKIKEKFKLHKNTHFLFKKVIYYFFLVTTVFIALPIAGIPMTIFTVLGGALAIGVGFGAQNLINNLISGLILFIEKPIRIGDIVVVNNQEGRVEDIGNRCVRIRRFDGIDVIIPNSFFLEQPVINWTLIDSEIKGNIKIGVAYSSDTKLVESLLIQCAKSHEKVLDSQEVLVFFEEFGGNSLNFQLSFWTHVDRPTDLRLVESEIRFKINKMFVENNISIAFPQRDMHLDSAKPLEIKIINND